MLLLATTTAKINVTTTAGATVDIHTDYIDRLADASFVGGVKNTSGITTAVTTDAAGSPALSTTLRNVKTIHIRNRHASASVDITVAHTDGTTSVEIFKCTLEAGQALQYKDDHGFEVVRPLGMAGFSQQAVADQVVGASVTNYLTGSGILIPTGRAVGIGTRFKWEIILSKSAAATAAMTFDIKVGTAGTTADTTRHGPYSTGVQTAVADVGRIVVSCVIRGPIGATSISHGAFSMEHNLAATGLGPTASVNAQSTSAGYAVTAAGLIWGLALTTGASHSITIHQIDASVEDLF